MPASADSPHSPRRLSTQESASAQDAEVLCFLAHSLQVNVATSEAKHAALLAEKEGGEPLERLMRAGSMVGLRIQPFRLSLSDAIWMAREEQPLIVWQADPGRWLLLRRHSFFRVRISAPDQPLESETISRSDLASQAGPEPCEGSGGSGSRVARATRRSSARSG